MTGGSRGGAIYTTGDCRRRLLHGQVEGLEHELRQLAQLELALVSGRLDRVLVHRHVLRAGDDEQVDAKAVEVAARLSRGAPEALRFTKHSLNSWLKSAWPAFEASLAFGILGFAGPEPSEGLAALREKRPPEFEQRSMV